MIFKVTAIVCYTKYEDDCGCDHDLWMPITTFIDADQAADIGKQDVAVRLEGFKGDVAHIFITSIVVNRTPDDIRDIMRKAIDETLSMSDLSSSAREKLLNARNMIVEGEKQ